MNQPGDQVRMAGKLYHVRAVVDDDYLVLRWWSRHKRHWVYTVELAGVVEIAAGWERKARKERQGGDACTR